MYGSGVADSVKVSTALLYCDIVAVTNKLGQIKRGRLLGNCGLVGLRDVFSFWEQMVEQ